MQQTTLTVFGKVFPHEPWHGDSSPAWYHTHISSFLLLTHATGQLMPPALTSSTVSKKKSLQLIQPPVWRQPPPVSDFLACQPLSLGKWKSPILKKTWGFQMTQYFNLPCAIQCHSSVSGLDPPLSPFCEFSLQHLLPNLFIGNLQ